MRLHQTVLGCVLAALAACPMLAQVATPAPTLSSIEAPYPAVQTRVRIAGGAYAPGSVAYGPAGTPLVLSGKNFGGGGTVTFPISGQSGGASATVTSWSPSILFLTVPQNAGSGLVVVTTDEGKASNGLPFIVTPGAYAAACPAFPAKSQLEITTASLPNGVANQSYSVTLSASGGTPPYTWSLTGGTLPSGLSLGASTGKISGTPTAGAGPLTLNVEAADSRSVAADAVLGLTVDSPTLAPATVYSYSAIYDHAGNVTSYTDQMTGEWNFTYDDLNRLASASPLTGVYSGQGQTLCLNYDSFGNRTQSDFQTTACSPSSDPATAKYSASNQVTWTTVNAAVNGFAYDAAGDATFDGNNYYAYDAEGRVCATQTSPYSGGTVAYGYIYDAEGRRVAKGTVTPGPLGQAPSCNLSANGFTLVESYLPGQGGERLTTTSWSGGAKAWQSTNVYGAGALLATYDAAGLHFHLADPLGSRRVQTNSAGEAELDCQSLPFGDQLNCFPDPNAPDDDQDEDATGSLTGIHFAGKERDTESGNDYFGARYYASSMGRFLSPDFQDDEDDPEPVPWADFKNPQTLNLYSYVQNNPLSHTDSDGHDVNVCTTLNGTQQCQQISNEQYQAGQQGNNGGLNVPSLNSIGTNGSGSITDANGNTVGTATYVSNGNLDPFTQASGFATLGAASRVVNAVGAVELGALSIAMPELLADSAIEAGLTGGAKLGEAAANRINHVFQAKHKLDVLVAQFGGKQGAYEAIASAAEKAVAGTAGPFQTTVQVGGQSVVVRGAVIDGVIKISTAFRP